MYALAHSFACGAIQQRSNKDDEGPDFSFHCMFDVLFHVILRSMIVSKNRGLQYRPQKNYNPD